MSERSSPLQREDLLQQLHGGLQELVDNRNAEAQAPTDLSYDPEAQMRAELENPAVSFMAYMRKAGGEFESFDILPDGTYERVDFGGFEKKPIGYFFKTMNEGIAESAEMSKWGLATGQLEKNLYASLSTARKTLSRKDSDPADQMFAAVLPAMVAMFTMPEDWEPQMDKEDLPEVPKRKRETQELLLFRKSISDLRRMAYQDDAALRVYIDTRRKIREKLDDNDDFIDEKMTEYLAIPENEELREGHVTFERRYIARRLLTSLASGRYTPAAFKEQLRFLEEHPEDASGDVEAPLIDEELDWSILPKGALEDIVDRKPTEEGSSKEEYDDPERLKWLARVALTWGDDAYVAVAPLDKRGSHKFYAAVLPQHLPNGQVIEHAVAESPFANHDATYVFRAEQGVEDNGTPWLTWRHVFAKDKKTARALGARRIKHTDYHEDNVDEYLTRPTKDLEKPGYDR